MLWTRLISYSDTIPEEDVAAVQLVSLYLLQCAAVCCSVLQCVPPVQCAAVCCSLVIPRSSSAFKLQCQCVAVCCSVLQCLAAAQLVSLYPDQAAHCSVSVLQCVAGVRHV